MSVARARNLDTSASISSGAFVPFCAGKTSYPVSVSSDSTTSMFMGSSSISSTITLTVMESSKPPKAQMVSVAKNKTARPNLFRMAKRLGAERIIMLGRHPARIALAKEFGATDVVSECG